MNLKVVLLIGFFLSANLSVVGAEVVDRKLEALLKQQVDINEGAQIRQIMPGELDDGVAGVEKAVLWTVLGPTYWRNQLSILANQHGQPTILATIPVMGMTIGFGPLKPDGTLQVETKISGPNDPLCCPSQAKMLCFRYRAGRLTAVMTHSE
jgi:hypothetical protein